MLNIKRKILTTVWVKETAETDQIVTTYGKVNPVRMINEGWKLVSQGLVEYVLSEEQFAESALRREEREE